MRISVGVLCCLWLFIFALCLPAAAETRYVSDRLIITVREGKAPGSTVITTLRTGDPVEVLEEDGRHLRIRTQDGEEGYVQSQYISTETPKPIVIARLEKERTRLKARLAEMEKLRGSAAETEAALAGTQKELQSVTEKYNALMEKSKGVIEITEERDRLQDEHSRLAAELETLQEENARLLRKGMIRWFLAGAGVLFVGWLAGKASRKQRRRYL